jgi:spore coat polysaccharide biosynthesis protein SpsF (cytidylyltransferase family)
MPFIYNRPQRFRIASLPVAGGVPDARFTIDTMEDLTFARAIVARLGSPGTVSVADLARALEVEPELAAINRDVRQKGWQEVEGA